MGLSYAKEIVSISSAVWAQYTNVTDRQTDHGTVTSIACQWSRLKTVKNCHLHPQTSAAQHSVSSVATITAMFDLLSQEVKHGSDGSHRRYRMLSCTRLSLCLQNSSNFPVQLMCITCLPVNSDGLRVLSGARLWNLPSVSLTVHLIVDHEITCYSNRTSQILTRLTHHQIQIHPCC